MIIQSEINDYETLVAMDWVYFYSSSSSISRIDGVVEIEEYSVWVGGNDSTNLKIKCNKGRYIIEPNSSYWYRRGKITISKNNIIKNDIFSNCDNAFSPLKNYLEDIQSKLLEDIWDVSNTKSSINKFSDNGINKVKSLKIAKLMGLSIPNTLISNNIKDISTFFEKCSHQIIIKSISDLYLISWYKHNYKVCLNFKSKLFKASDGFLKIIQNHPIKFPILFQEYISKKYEIRIFYLFSRFFPMAIFSQQNEKTKIDFRNYDKERPNRLVPYVLPKDIEEKLDNFMKAIDLNCGSIDMICTGKDDYVFLEVNPIGQYHWLEMNCNYPISKMIAEDLLYNKRK